MPYNSRANVGRLLAELYDTNPNLKLGGFWSQLQASDVSSPTDTMKESDYFVVYERICLSMTLYIYIYIYI